VIPVQLARSTAPVANGGVNTILVLTDLTEQKAREMRWNAKANVFAP